MSQQKTNYPHGNALALCASIVGNRDLSKNTKLIEGEELLLQQQLTKIKRQYFKVPVTAIAANSFITG